MIPENSPRSLKKKTGAQIFFIIDGKKLNISIWNEVRSLDGFFLHPIHVFTINVVGTHFYYAFDFWV